jgi:hypothetical protein
MKTLLLFLFATAILLHAQPTNSADKSLMVVENLIGTWNLNLAKSEKPERLTGYTVTLQRVQGVMRVIEHSSTAGLIVDRDYLVALDGSWTRRTYGMYQSKLDRVNANRFELRGRPVRDLTAEDMQTFTLSDDRKTMTLKTKQFTVLLEKQP